MNSAQGKSSVTQAERWKGKGKENHKTEEEKKKRNETNDRKKNANQMHE